MFTEGSLELRSAYPALYCLQYHEYSLGTAWTGRFRPDAFLGLVLAAS